MAGALPPVLPRETVPAPGRRPVTPLADQVRYRSSMLPNDSADDPDRKEQTRAEPEREYVGAGFIGGLVILILLGLVLVALIAQNAETVPFSLLWFDAEISLAALLLGAAVLAVLVSELVGLVWRRRRRKYRALRQTGGA